LGKVPKILIVDNAHLLSTNQKANLAEWNKKHDTKLILLGSKETLLPQQRGNSIKELTDHGINTISISSQQNSHVALVPANNMSFVISRVANRIVEVAHSEDRHHAMAAHYSHLSFDDRKQSWLVGQSKKTVEDLNLLAHNELTAQNQVSKTRSFNVLIPVFLQEGKAALATSYQKNQVVRFNDTYSSLGINRGEYLRIVQHHEKSNRVILQKTDGNQIIWQPDRIAGTTSGKVELFNEKERDMGIGESVIFHRSIKARQIVKGERFTVEAIRQQKMKLKNTEGKSIVIDLANPYHRHIDYGYATTPHAIAHENPVCLIADLPSQSFHTDQRRFYQAISQPKEAWIYTDHYSSLVAHLEKKSGDRLTAHETLTQSEEMKKNLHSLYNVLEKHIVARQGAGMTAHQLTRASVNAVDYAMRHLTEREAVFKHKELLQTAMKYALGDVTKKMLNQATLEMEKAGILQRKHTSRGTLWTTFEAVKREREILALVMRDRGTLQPIASDKILSQYCDATSLRPEQVAAIKAITQSPDRVLSVQGRAGTGKTTMMTALEDVLLAKELIVDTGYSLQGIAPTHRAVRELTVRDIKAQTLDSFLLDMKRLQKNKIQHDFSKTILIVDEASMVSNRKMLEVLNVAHDLNFRQVIPTGDTEQNPSIEAGKPHWLIQRKLDTTIYLKDIQRQKDSILKEAVKAIYDGKVAKTFSILDKSIIEIKAKDKTDESKELAYQKRVEAIVADYIPLMMKGENVQMITPSHIDRKAVNEETRFQLDSLNLLKGEAHSFSVLSSKDMTGVERSEAMNFEPNQILRFAVSSGKAIKSGDYFVIKRIDKKQNLLTLSAMDGSNKEVSWQVPRSQNRVNNSVEVFKQEERNLKVGDKIVWVRSDRKEGTIGTDFAYVTHLEKGMITVKRSDNSEFTFNGKDEKFQHWDHGYAITVYGAQGGTYSTVLGLFESYRNKLMNLKNFLVTITRPENALRIYTDDKQDLQYAIRNNTGDKSSSLEVIGEVPAIKNKNKQEKEVGQLPENIAPTASEHHKAIDQNKQNIIPRFDKDSVERIKEGLNRDAETIALDILGKPKVRGSHFLKFGDNQGSLSVTIKGEKQGWWNDFSEGGGRSMLSFIQKYAGLNKQEALEYGAKWLGFYPTIDSGNEQVKTKKISEKSQVALEKTDKKLQQEYKNKIEFAKKLAAQSQPIQGTLAEKYLNEHRAITMATYPDDIRFHAGIYSKLNGKTLPAMLVVARNKSGEIQAVQATYLDENSGRKIDKSSVVIQKQTFGLLQGATVTIQGEKGAPTLIAEGTETGLSLANAIQKVNVKITLGKSNFKNIDTKTLSEKVIFCLDNDGKNSQADKMIIESAKRLINSHKQVAFMLPTSLSTPKQDYNDILKQIGQEVIRQDFEKAVSCGEWYDKNQNSLISTTGLTHSKMINQAITHDKSLQTTLVNSAINSVKQPQISDKTISDFNREQTKNNHFNETKNKEAYSEMTHRTHQVDVTKTIPKMKEFEQEI
jgi:hypothetical protein